MGNRRSGGKRPAVLWFFKDWKNDASVGSMSPVGRCVWFEFLQAMFDSGEGQVHGSALALSRLARVTLNELFAALAEIADSNSGIVHVDCVSRSCHGECHAKWTRFGRGLTHEKPTDVTQDVTPIYTVVSRRLSRDADKRKKTKLRQDRRRDKRRHAVVTPIVTPESRKLSRNGHTPIAFAFASSGSSSENSVVVSEDLALESRRGQLPPTGPAASFQLQEGKADAPKPRKAPKATHPQAARVLDSLNERRKRLKSTLRALQPTAKNLELISDRLHEGNTVEDCQHVLDVYEAEAKAKKITKWLNQVYPFRSDSFAKTLAADPEEAGAIGTYPDHEKRNGEPPRGLLARMPGGQPSWEEVKRREAEQIARLEAELADDGQHGGANGQLNGTSRKL